MPKLLSEKQQQTKTKQTSYFHVQKVKIIPEIKFFLLINMSLFTTHTVSIMLIVRLLFWVVFIILSGVVSHTIN